MAISDITKPMALDETLQATNGKMDSVITKLQGIIDALGLDTSVYKPKGNIACAQLVPALLIESNIGNVYNVTDNGTTTSDFAEGAGKPIHVGDNVAIVDVGTGGQSEYKFDLLAGMVDLTNYIQKSNTSGLVKNDGTVDTKDYAEKVAGATSGNLAGLNGSGNLTDSGWNGAKDTTSISGNPISISGLKANQLAVNPIITFEPIQAGSGTPSPSNIRAISGYDKVEVLSCGVNIFDEQLEIGTYDTNTGEKSSSISNCLRSKNKYRIIPNEWYALVYPSLSASNYVRFFIYDAAMNYLGTTNVTNSTFRITTANAAYIAFRLDTQYGTTYGNNISINYPATQTSYVASNKATSISESLGQTVYWGRLNVRTGEFEVLGVGVDMGDLTWTFRGTNTPFYSTALSNYYWNDSTQAPPLICSCYETVDQGHRRNYTIAGYNMATNTIMVNDDSYNGDANAFTAAVTGQMLVYGIQTPFTIQLTPHEISLLKDYAYVSTNGTNISLDYHNGELASLADVSQLGKTVNNLLNNQTAVISVSQDISYLAKKHYLKIGNIINLSCEATGTFTNGSYTNIGTIVYKPTNDMWFPLINAISGALAGTVLLTSEGLIRALPSANGLTKVAINLMFIANQ